MALIIQPDIDRKEAVDLWASMAILIDLNAKTPKPHPKIHEVCVAVSEAATALIKAVDDYAEVSHKCMTESFSFADIQRGVTAAEAYEDAKKKLAEAKKKLNEKE